MDRQSRYLKDSSAVFYLPKDDLSHPLHHTAKEQAQINARLVGQALEAQVESNAISRESLFDYRYIPIPDTNPPKHSTAYDALCDQVLPPIQEAVLQNNPRFIYAITADFNGYVPTHNDKFCQPLTGDKDKDLTGNRTKRIFDDRVGSLVGRHSDPFKLQIYRRDTGELMFDMSVPIHVFDQHWGGFRIGYRIE